MEGARALLVMAVTTSLGRPPDRGDMVGPATGVAKKQNVPPFRGGTCGSFYAHREDCQRIAGTGWRWQGRSRRLNNGKCGRATRTLARESLRIVAFRLSGTTSRAAVLILSVLVLGVNARARFPCPARAKGFCRQGILGNGTRKRASANWPARHKGKSAMT